MTLTEMLADMAYPDYMAKVPGGGILIRTDNAKEVFKQWLKGIPLGGVLDKSPLVNDARHDFILLVDEP